MLSARRLHHTYSDYLKFESESSSKHEYCDGEIFAMARRTPEHAALSAQIISVIQQQLPASCRVMTSDVRVRIEASDLTTYPDATVICGPLQRSPDDNLAVVNPVLLVEVTSPSSEDYDRGEKLSHYKQLSTLKTVIVLSHRSRRLTIFERDDSHWVIKEFRSTEVATCLSPPLKLNVDVVYAVLDDL